MVGAHDAGAVLAQAKAAAVSSAMFLHMCLLGSLA